MKTIEEKDKQRGRQEDVVSRNIIKPSDSNVVKSGPLDHTGSQ